MTKTTDVILTIDQTTEDGKDRGSGDQASLPPAEARRLIHEGRARSAADDDASSGDPTATRRPSRPAKKAAAKPPTGSADTDTPATAPTPGAGNDQEGTS